MIGRKLKKNSVALDVVNFGEEDDAKTEKLEALVAAVNNNDSSHIVHVPPGSNALSDVLIRYLVARSSLLQSNQRSTGTNTIGTRCYRFFKKSRIQIRSGFVEYYIFMYTGTSE